MSALRILHVVPSLDASLGGLPVVAEALCAELVRLGFDARILTVGPVEARDSSPTPRVTTLPGWGPRQYGLTMARGEVDAAVRSADIVHVHGVWTVVGALALRSAAKTGASSYVQPHGMLDPHALGRKGLKKSVYGALVEFPLLRQATGMIYTCEHERAVSVDAVPNLPRGFVVANGVTPRSAPPAAEVAAFRGRHGLRADALRLLFLGRLHEKKGLRPLIDAVGLLGSERRAMELIVVGSGDHSFEAALRARVEALGIGDSVHFLGAAYADEKWLAYAACDAFILPSFQEGASIAVLEAGAMGLPLFLSPYVATWREMDAAGVVRVVEPSPAAIADGLRSWFVEAPNMRKAAMAKAVHVVREFSWPSAGQALAAVYVSDPGRDVHAREERR